MVSKANYLKALKIVVIAEFFVLLTTFYSKTFYINLQVAFLSSFLIMVGSFYAYKKMVSAKIKTQSYEGDRDPLDAIDDPHELHEEAKLNHKKEDEIDLKEILKQEKKKIKIFSLKSAKDGSSASFSLFRLGGYLFLILGFISLKNNNVLDISVYLPSLLVGIVVGYIFSKEIYS